MRRACLFLAFVLVSTFAACDDGGGSDSGPGADGGAGPDAGGSSEQDGAAGPASDGGGDPDADAGPDGGVNGPPARGFSVASKDVVIDPGQEITYCYYFRTPNTDALPIRKWKSTMTRRRARSSQRARSLR